MAEESEKIGTIYNPNTEYIKILETMRCEICDDICETLLLTQQSSIEINQGIPYPVVIFRCHGKQKTVPFRDFETSTFREKFMEWSRYPVFGRDISRESAMFCTIEEDISESFIFSIDPFSSDSKFEELDRKHLRSSEE